MQISMSRLRAYMQCPQRFRFRYVDEAEPEFISSNLVFGTAFHHAISQFHRGGNQMDGSGMTAKFVAYWNAQKAACQRTGQPLRMKDTEEVLFQKAHALCAAYVATFADLVPATPEDAELVFEVPLFDPVSGHGALEHTLVGAIDLVANASVYEFKTGGRAASQIDADSSIQLTAYALAHEYLFDAPAERLFLVTLVKTNTPRIDIKQTTRRGADYMDLVDTGVAIARAVEAQVFYRNREYIYGCHNCEYERACLGCRNNPSTGEEVIS